MSRIFFEIVILLCLAVINGIFSMAEIALVSVRESRLQASANQGSHSAKQVLKLKQAPGLFFSTIQIVITLIGITAGAFGESSLAGQLADVLRRVDWLEEYGGSIGFVMVVFGITYINLVIGELVPKKIASNRPELVARRSVRLVSMAIWVMRPLAWLLARSTDLVTVLLGLKTSEDSPVTEDEIKLLLADGVRAGVFVEQERDIVARVFRFADRKAWEIMTPRHEVFWLDTEVPSENTLQKLIDNRHSRYPICQGNLDDIVGIVFAKHLIPQLISEDRISLEQLAEEPLFIHKDESALSVLRKFKENQRHIGIVRDSDKRVEGIITDNDILDAVVGDIRLSTERNSAKISRREDGSYLVDGDLPTQVFIDEFRVQSNLRDQISGYSTVATFVASLFHQDPTVADTVSWDGYRIEIVDLDGDEIDKVLVSENSE